MGSNLGRLNRFPVFPGATMQDVPSGTVTMIDQLVPALFVENLENTTIACQANDHRLFLVGF